MIYKKLIKPFVCIALILTGLKADAQIAILQSTIDKLESYKNFSYQSVYKQKDAFSDTLLMNRKLILFRAPEDKELGYFFKFYDIDSKAINLYNGKDLISLSLRDSTYNTRKSQALIFLQSLLVQLNRIKNYLNKNPLKIIQASDTIYNSINSYHLIIINKDTIVNNDHLYAQTHLFIDKKTGLPVGKITKSRGSSSGKEVTDYYTEDRYSNYQIDQDNINIASFAMPEGFHSPKQKTKEETALLAAGTIVPDWTLYDTDGKKMSLSQLKGKVVLLDFFFVGCIPCMNSLKPLDQLYAKYKNKNVEILSISDRDNEKSVAAFKKVQKIKNKMYPTGADVAKSYHINAAPIFYLIDQEGKVASVVDGYTDDFEKKMSAIIDILLKKS